MKFDEDLEHAVKDPFAEMIKHELVSIIKWADQQNPRSLQSLPGPSDLGDPCDRRLGYKLAGVPAVNKDFDPWPAIMGTAVHSWLDRAVQSWMQEHRSRAWGTETRVQIDDLIGGSSDLYSHKHQAVIDWKGAGPDVMRKFKKEGPPRGYQVQAHLYGLGFERRGWPVRKVVLACFPRAGWIRDLYVWTADYDQTVAEDALSRMYKIAQDLMQMDILKESHRWEQVPATPSNGCGWCPLYDPRRDLERGADATGCPGR